MNKNSHLDTMYPPTEMDFVGGINFREVGSMLCGIIANNCGIEPHDRVLDVGCGIGRLAIPLTQIISSVGSYDGFDIVEPGIKWCQEKITSRYPHFQFHLADVRNDLYNPQARNRADDYIFPYPNNSFDLVILTSVFTHMLAKPMKNYLSQISRVLEIGGRSFITFYLRTSLSEEGIRAGKSRFNFNTQHDGCWTLSDGVPEAAVCYDLASVKALYAEHSLSIEKIVTGKWWDGSEPTAQDFIVAHKI